MPDSDRVTIRIIDPGQFDRIRDKLGAEGIPESILVRAGLYRLEGHSVEKSLRLAITRSGPRARGGEADAS